MLAGLFPVAYAIVFTCLLLQAFRMMRMGSGMSSSVAASPKDRTGLTTVHPELLNESGEITKEDLLTVRFTELEGFTSTEA